jgi:hypothetical protein
MLGSKSEDTLARFAKVEQEILYDVRNSSASWDLLISDVLSECFYQHCSLSTQERVLAQTCVFKN